MEPNRPAVFVGDQSRRIQFELKQRLDAEGVHAYLARSEQDPNSPTEFIGGFKCALVTLEPINGKDDPIDEVDLLQIYQPSLPVAFLNEDASPRMLDRALALGPIFRKEDQLDEAIAWVLERAKSP